MSESNQFDNMNNNSDTAAENTVSDTYVTESGDDLYRTPDLTSDLQQEHSDTEVAEEKQEDQHEEGLIDYAGNAVDGMTAHVENQFQENQTAQNDNPFQNNNSYEEQNVSGGSPYNNNAYNEQNVQNGSPYSNNPYGNSAYNGQNMQNSSPYSNNPYRNDAYNGQNMQNGSPYNNNPYGNGAYNGQNAQNGNSYGNASYNGQTVQNHYQNSYGNPPYGNGNNQYSPYAVPTKKNTGLIVGIVIGIIVLFLIAIFALAYKVVDLYTSDKDKKRSIREEYKFDYDDDEWADDQNRDDYYNDGDHHYDDHYYDDYYDDYFDDYFNDGYGDYYDDYFGSGNNGDGGEHIDDDKYYSLHDEIRNDLTYSVKLEDYKYDTTYENVDIQVTYPVIAGDDVPNLDKLNSVIKDEADFITEYFEEEYQDYMMDDSDYFTAVSIGYVTYMDEEKLSIAFSEHMYSDYYDDVFLYCINIDMENGIVLDNESLLGIDDDFSVDFRRRSDIQNGEISYLTMMTDQEITRHFKSTDIIVFYIPQGMEIGFNYDAGWVTVTYEDYEKYLKVF